MSNPTQEVHVYDMPLRVIAGLSTLAKTPEEDDNTETGIVVSEVGNPQLTTHPAWADSFVSYQLRAPRVCHTPDFLFGGLDLGNAFSAFLPRRFPAPAVGTRLVINPVVTKAQQTIIGLYKFVHANFHYIVHVPAPLGTGIYLKVYAPELDETTVTRGIRFKPSAQPTVALSLPWSNDFSQVPIQTPRLGQSGGSLVIETIEDNSSEQVNTPLQITVWCCVSDIKLTGYNVSDTTGFNVAGFNFLPQIPPPPPTPPTTPEPIPVVTGIQQSDNEVTAEGGKLITDFIYDKSAIPLAPEVETQAEKPELPAQSVAQQKNDTGHLATKWYDYKKLTLSSPNNFDWQVLTIDPYNDVILNQNGEALVLPWKRNVWTTGSQAIGYMRSLVAQINIPRPPQISGVLEVKDSINASSITLIEFGGKAEIPLIPTVFNGLSATLPRHWLNPWMRTAESKVQIVYRIVAFNRTSDIADLDISLLLRPGDSQFQLPQKPDNNLLPVEPDLVQQVTDYFASPLRNTNLLPFVEGIQQSLQEHKPQHLADPNVYITPAIAHTAEQYSVHTELGNEEDIELDEFPVLVFKGDIPVDEVTSIQLDLAKIYDFAWDAEENAISQKFKRFAHIIPKTAGGFGPVIGNYTITANLPTGVAGRIVHNCLPGDSVDLAVSRIFGLKSLLGIAGSAVTAIGGPLLNGLVNTAAPVLSGAAHAIGGNVVGGLADAALGLASNILTPKQKEQPSANSNAISGDIPISRFVEMVKFVEQNYKDNPIFPTLLVEPQNFITNALTKLEKIPIEVFANMRNVKVERNIFDRTVVPIVEEDEPDVIIPTQAFGYILRDFLQHKRAFVPGTRQNVYFKQFLSTIIRRRNDNFVTLKEITQQPITEDLVITLIGRVKRYLNNLDGETSTEFSNTIDL